MTLKLPLDDNGHSIHVLAPVSTTEHTLQAAGGLALSADPSALRIVRMYTEAPDCKIAVGENVTTADMPLPAGSSLVIKLDFSMGLYASGTGSLFITLME